jgi:hypothetical protein
MGFVLVGAALAALFIIGGWRASREDQRRLIQLKRARLLKN